MGKNIFYLLYNKYMAPDRLNAAKPRPPTELVGHMLSKGFKEAWQGQEVHIRGISPSPRIISGYIAALEAWTKKGNLLIPPVHHLYVPITHIDPEQTVQTGKVVLIPKTEQKLPFKTMRALERAKEAGLVGLTTLSTEEEYAQAAKDMHLAQNRFFLEMIDTSQLVFVSEWVGPNVQDYLIFQSKNSHHHHRVAISLGTTLAALHNHGLIAGDTHLEQFVVREEDRAVLRVDLINIRRVSQAEGKEGFETEYAMVLSSLTWINPDLINHFEDGYFNERE
jgi:tRNA A-37 threonylcarbamoyl transferase component Bud32